MQIPNNISQTCKGVKRAVRHTLKLDTYRDVLLHGATAPRIRIPSLMSKHHKVYMIDRAKVSINPFDSKRYWLNSVQSVPYGHYSISDWDEPTVEEEQAFRFHVLDSINTQEDEEMARIDDAPMARLREIQKRQWEEKGSASTTVTTRAVPNIPGLTFREKRPRKTTLNLEEMRAMRQ